MTTQTQQSFPIRLQMGGLIDREGNDYYLLVPEFPILVDLSKAVILIHPWENEDGTKFGAQMTIRMNNEELRSNKYAKLSDGEGLHSCRHGKRRDIVDKSEGDSDRGD